MILEYGEDLRYATVDMGAVHVGKKMVFTFRDGWREMVLLEE